MYVRGMRVVVVPCLQDNFAYLVIDGSRCAVVDPGEAAPVEAVKMKPAPYAMKPAGNP